MDSSSSSASSRGAAVVTSSLVINPRALRAQGACWQGQQQLARHLSLLLEERLPVKIVLLFFSGHVRHLGPQVAAAGVTSEPWLPLLPCTRRSSSDDAVVMLLRCAVLC